MPARSQSGGEGGLTFNDVFTQPVGGTVRRTEHTVNVVLTYVVPMVDDKVADAIAEALERRARRRRA